jgi:hypothetical protein
MGEVIQFPLEYEPILYREYKVKRTPPTPHEWREVNWWAWERGVSFEEQLCLMWEQGVTNKAPASMREPGF